MKLSDYLKYENICIQCHDNPDADSLASGFALYSYFYENGKNVRFIYSGKFKIKKSNLVLMVEKFNIPIEYVKTLPECDILITTDCQYGEGNVTYFEHDNIAVIDHHQYGGEDKENYYIMSNYGSCSTVVWTLLEEEKFDCNKSVSLATALYYGLYCDTGQLSEIYLPSDKDLRDTMKFDKVIFRLLVNTNLSAEEMQITGDALSTYIYNEENRFAIIAAQPCDPNILGIISDLAIQVDDIDVAVAYIEINGGYKLSIRSCIKETKANDIAQYFCEGVGNGGGHTTKSGAFIPKKNLLNNYADKSFKDYLIDKITDYNKAYQIITAREYTIDTKGMKKYLKKNYMLGYVKTVDIIKEGTPIVIRTLEGDIESVVSKDTYIMIGINGEVYPIEKDKFDKTYKVCEGKPDITWIYEPRIRNVLDGSVYKLGPHIQTCIATGKTYIQARPLNKNVKIFTTWDEGTYLKGEVGDYLAVRSDDIHDIYVINKEIFLRTYEGEEIGDNNVLQ